MNFSLTYKYENIVYNNCTLYLEEVGSCLYTFSRLIQTNKQHTADVDIEECNNVVVLRPSFDSLPIPSSSSSGS